MLRCVSQFTVKLTVVEWVVVPLVPVMVSVTGFFGALLAAVIVRVEVPEVAIDAGLNVAVTRLGTPLTERLTVPVNPFSAPTVTV